MLVSWILPPTSMKVRCGPLTMMSAMSSRASSGSSGPKPSTSLQMSSSRSSCSAIDSTRFLMVDDLVHDVADFFARALLVELRQRRQIDRLDQRAEDHRLGLEVAFRALIGLRIGARRHMLGGPHATARRRRRGRQRRRRRLDAHTRIGSLTEHARLSRSDAYARTLGRCEGGARPSSQRASPATDRTGLA